jgi:hypothetical protein
LAILIQNKAMEIMQKLDHNANFVAENCRKSQKIVIITSTPGKTRKIVIFVHHGS